MAGVPQVLMPRFSDQFYWGGRVSELGIGTVVPAAGSTDTTLTAALTNVLAPEFVRGARSLSRAIEVDGVAEAVAHITNLAERASS